MAEQWVITVVAEGEHNPWDITSEFLETLRIRGNYDIVATSISPASGIRGNHHNDVGATPVASTCGGDDNHECFCGADHGGTRSFGDITAGSVYDDDYFVLDGHDPSVYAGRQS